MLLKRKIKNILRKLVKKYYNFFDMKLKTEFTALLIYIMTFVVSILAWWNNLSANLKSNILEAKSLENRKENFIITIWGEKYKVKLDKIEEKKELRY